MCTNSSINISWLCTTNSINEHKLHKTWCQISILLTADSGQIQITIYECFHFINLKILVKKKKICTHLDILIVEIIERRYKERI